MTIASSNFTILGYGNYTGTPPTVLPAALQELQMTGESLGYQTQSISSQNINSSRQLSDTITTGYDVSGGIQIEFAPKVYDKFLSAALWAGWQSTEVKTASTTVVIDHDDSDEDTARTITMTGLFADEPTAAKLCPGQFFKLEAAASAGIPDALEGVYQVDEYIDADSATVKQVDGATPFAASTTPTTDDKAKVTASMIRAPKDGSASEMIRQCFLLEKKQSDLATPLYTYYSKCYVNTFSLSAQSAALLTGSIDFMGELSEMQEATKASGGGAYTAATSFNGFNAVSHVKEVIVNGVDLNGSSENGLYMQGLDFQITNNLRGVKAIGNLGNIDTLAGQLGITGNLNVFFENKTMYTLFTEETEFAFSFRVEDENGDGYVFSFPRVVISSDSMSSGGNDQDLIENMQWTSMFDETLETSMQIDRLYGTY